MVTISRYFYENVELVANVCPRCYEECCDVKIISVNMPFLGQIYKKSSQDMKIPAWLSFVRQTFETNDNFQGFSPEEAQTSKTLSDTMQKIIKDFRDDLRNFEIHHFTTTECFEGFPSHDVKNSCLYHEKVKKNCDLMRYKILKRMSVSIIMNIKRRRLKHRSKATVKNWKKAYSISDENERLGTSKYFANNVNFNNNLMEPNKSNKPRPVTEIDTNYNEDCGFKTENVIVYENDINRETFHNVSFRFTEKIKSGELFDIKLESVDYESEYCRLTENATESIHIAKFSSKFATQPSWVPPRSPHNLIEEILHHDPWALLAATIFLNKTSCTVARPFVFWFLTENPDPLKVLDRFPKDLEKYFCDLGLQRTRAVQVYRMSHDFLFKNWKKASELYGIGSYGESAFRMFCLGDFSAEPKDRFLKIYKAWYEKLHLKR